MAKETIDDEEIEYNMVNVQIADVMYNEIMRIMRDHPKYGYESVEEFLRDSLRINFMRLTR